MANNLILIKQCKSQIKQNLMMISKINDLQSDVKNGNVPVYLNNDGIGEVSHHTQQLIIFLKRCNYHLEFTISELKGNI